MQLVAISYFESEFPQHPVDEVLVADILWDLQFDCRAPPLDVFAGVQHKSVENHWRRGLSQRSEEHTSELQSLMRNSYAVFCLKKTNDTKIERGIYITAN